MVSKGQNTRDNILRAAQELFYHQGFTATSYADIGNRTGLGKGNIQYHFKSKDDILTSVVESRLERIGRLLAGWTKECTGTADCIEHFIAMIEASADDLTRYGCPMGTLNDELGKNRPELQLAARRMFDLFGDWLEARFLDVFSAEEAKDKAEFLLAMAQGVAVLGHTYRDAGLVRRQTRNMRDWLKTVCPDG